MPGVMMEHQRNEQLDETGEHFRIMDDWQQHQRDIQEAEQRGRLLAEVSALKNNQDEIKVLVKDIQMRLSLLVSRAEFDKLEATVAGLSAREKYIAGGLGVLIFLSQVIPKLFDLMRHTR